MDDALQHETRNLVESWMQHDAGMLGDYLVSDVEDPRVNVQSILTRHFIIVSLFGTRFEPLLEAELRFGSVLNWAQAIQGELASADDFAAVAHALKSGAADVEGIAIPAFVLQTYRGLPQPLGNTQIPNYIDLWLQLSASAAPGPTLPEAVLNLFERLWAEHLGNEPETDLSVLEPACGSANDFRFFERYGLARLCKYHGFDLCEKNVRNALQLFPKARFTVGNVFEIDAPDRGYDFSVVHDLLEHLSVRGMERALEEICRVTCRAFCFGLFNGWEADEHAVQPVNQYHWNRLSVLLLRQRLAQAGFEVQVVHIDTFLRWRFGCDRTHNKNAYTIFGERRK
jgi:SAM-dependent methyltransferase